MIRDDSAWQLGFQTDALSNGRTRLIDLPQVVSPRENQNAFRIFERDIHRECEYCARLGLQPDAARLAQEMWESHGYAIEEEIPGEEISS